MSINRKLINYVMVLLESKSVLKNEIDKSAQIWTFVQDMLLIFKKTHNNAKNIFPSVPQNKRKNIHMCL